jgi:hypothetical protein
MTFIPTQTGFRRLEDSEKLLRAIFANYPSLVLFDIRKGSRDQNRRRLTRESLWRSS